MCCAVTSILYIVVMFILALCMSILCILVMCISMLCFASIVCNVYTSTVLMVDTSLTVYTV